jgi:hypothetical protein
MKLYGAEDMACNELQQSSQPKTGSKQLVMISGWLLTFF